MGEPGKPGRPSAASKRSRGDSPPGIIDGPVRLSAAGLRSKPSVVLEIYSIKGVRLTAVDCERASSDEATLEARRSDRPEDAVAEFQVHGMFKMAADGRPFPDTYYLTIRELSESGLSKAYIKQSMGVLCELLGTVIGDELDELDGEEGEEGEREA
mmetsp:Transcript_45277/g.125549  ORF Transcript_45277/g.125549 Transcript_45277/m.125549 type:complete len:156 (-) Transcript_45277:94-561(-)